jgi:hypothetical protein
MSHATKNIRSPLHGAVLLKVLLEEAGSLHVDTHGGEHDGEVVFMAVVHALVLLDQAGLTADLSGNLQGKAG